MALTGKFRQESTTYRIWQILGDLYGDPEPGRIDGWWNSVLGSSGLQRDEKVELLSRAGEVCPRRRKPRICGWMWKFSPVVWSKRVEDQIMGLWR